jgi:hypothetical protein
MQVGFAVNCGAVQLCQLMDGVILNVELVLVSDVLI